MAKSWEDKMGAAKKPDQEDGAAAVAEARAGKTKTRKSDPFDGFKLEDCEPYDGNSESLEKAEIVDKFKKGIDGTTRQMRTIYPGSPRFFLEHNIDKANCDNYNLIGVWNSGSSIKQRNCRTFNIKRDRDLTGNAPGYQEARERNARDKKDLKMLQDVNKIPVKVTRSACRP
jgi:hypothetical protein